MNNRHEYDNRNNRGSENASNVGTAVMDREETKNKHDQRNEQGKKKQEMDTTVPTSDTAEKDEKTA